MTANPCQYCGGMDCDDCDCHKDYTLGAEIVMTYENGQRARIPVPDSAICEHKHIRKICPKCNGS